MWRSFISLERNTYEQISNEYVPPWFVNKVILLVRVVAYSVYWNKCDMADSRKTVLKGAVVMFQGKYNKWKTVPRIFFFINIWFVRLLALRPLVAYCASLG
jgi:hypothetical protein